MPHRGVGEECIADHVQRTFWTCKFTIARSKRLQSSSNLQTSPAVLHSQPPVRAWNLEFSRQASAFRASSSLIDLSYTPLPRSYQPLSRRSVTHASTRHSRKRCLLCDQAVHQHHEFLSQQRDLHSQPAIPHSKHPCRHSQGLECFRARIFSACECVQRLTSRHVSPTGHYPSRASPACIACPLDGGCERREPPEHERGHEDRKVTRGTGGAA
jgi:hypothetical protein